MIYIFLSAISLLAVGAYMIYKGNLDKDGNYDFPTLIAVFAVIFGIMCTLGVAFTSVGWVGAGYRAEIINREYGTTYTRAEVYYASDVIETIRQLDRKRYEVEVK